MKTEYVAGIHNLKGKINTRIVHITKLTIRDISHSSPNVIANGTYTAVTQAGLYHGLDIY
jgi:hypothetical protein